MGFKGIFIGFSRAALLLGFVVMGAFFAAPAQAQEATNVDPKAALKTSLTDLSALYQTQLEKLEKRQQQSKELYDDGLISRLEYENGEKALVDARAKVEEITRQIAEVDKPLMSPEVVSEIAADANVAWSTGNNKIDNLIRHYGKQYGVDPFLIFCTMAQESSFSAGATSNKGAQGLMQLMPGTAARYGVTNPYDVAQSIKGGTRYLKDLLEMFNGRVDLALAGYNAGEGAVLKYGKTIPPYTETRNYVKLILKRYNTRKPAS